jgi:hypothetical protein
MAAQAAPIAFDPSGARGCGPIKGRVLRIEKEVDGPMRGCLDYDSRKSGETPTAHPPFVKQDGRRLDQIQGDLKITPVPAQEHFGPLQSFILG